MVSEVCEGRDGYFSKEARKKLWSKVLYLLVSDCVLEEQEEANTVTFCIKYPKGFNLLFSTQ